MKDGKFAARQQGDNITIFVDNGQPMDYSLDFSQEGIPKNISKHDFDMNYAHKFYLIPDPNWKQNPPSRISPEMRAKFKVGTVQEAATKGKAQLKSKEPEASEGYSAEALLSTFALYLGIYRATDKKEDKVSALTIGKYLVKLDPSLKDAVKQTIEASKEEELEL